MTMNESQSLVQQLGMPLYSGRNWIRAVGILAILGGVSARAGGAPMTPATVRVLFWGALAMAVTAGAGMLFGAA